jgi:phosphoadenosine phosphosulfate reductase
MTTKKINQRHDARFALDLVSAASLDRDLMKRIVAARNLVSGPIVFTTSFSVEDQAIAHAIFEHALEVEVVTLARASTGFSPQSKRGVHAAGCARSSHSGAPSQAPLLGSRACARSSRTSAQAFPLLPSIRITD